MSISDRKPFSYNLFKLLLRHDFSVNSEALAKYVINCSDGDRARNLMILLNHSSGFSKELMPIYFGQIPIYMNLVQAYIVTTRDSVEVADQCVNIMVQSGLNVNDKVQEASGSKYAFDKFAAVNSNLLSATALQIAAKYKKQGFWH